MNPSYRWLILILFMITALGLSACSPKQTTQTKIDPAILETIEGEEFSRVVLTEKAAERIHVQTTEVREEQVTRILTIGGQVLAAANAPSTSGEASAPMGLSGVTLRVPVSEIDLNRIDHSQPAQVMSLTGNTDGPRMVAQPVDLSTLNDSEDDDTGEAHPDIDPDDSALYYLIDSAEPGLTQGQGVFVEVMMSGNGTPRKVVPYAAVLYGVHGETWVYTNPEPLVFVRSPITIDYIEGDLAILSEGPEVGTAVVTLGAAELFGTETGVSK
jgi:hypothetical protein